MQDRNSVPLGKITRDTGLFGQQLDWDGGAQGTSGAQKWAAAPRQLVGRSNTAQFDYGEVGRHS
jgi:hypothetical protein